MTVAAVILAGTAESALADAAGRASVRRVVESAWAGGAVPIVVVAQEQDGRVAAALAGSPALLSEAPGDDAADVEQVARGARLAVEQVGDTDAVLVWPGRLVWADAETVTSLIERHGVSPEAVLQPTFEGEAGWPVLVPMHAVEVVSRLPPGADSSVLGALDAAGAPLEQVEVGDPGVVHGRETPIDALPDYAGPPAPTGGPPPDWGPSAADHRDEEPALEGPALAPYVQAEAEGE